MIIDLGLGPDGGPGVRNNIFSLNGKCRRDPGRGQKIRFWHAFEKLSRVSGNGLEITALAFGVKGIKSEGGFSGPGNTRDDVKFSLRKNEVKIL
jgi:hypothetical protein